MTSCKFTDCHAVLSPGHGARTVLRGGVGHLVLFASHFQRTAFWGSLGISAESDENYSHAFTTSRLWALKSRYSPALCWQMEKITFLTCRIKKSTNANLRKHDCLRIPDQTWHIRWFLRNSMPFSEHNWKLHHATCKWSLGFLHNEKLVSLRMQMKEVTHLWSLLKMVMKYSS